MSLLLGRLNSLKLKAPVSLLHVRWKLIHQTLSPIMSSAEGERGAVEIYQKTHTFLSPLVSIKTCQEIHQFIIRKLLFTTCEFKRQKSKLSKFHYFSLLFNFV